jgi:adenylate kinase family enzyme
MVFGLPGSGKSTFCLELAEKTQLPLYHLDKYFFLENWIERDYAEFLEIQKSFVNEERWIIDGNSMQSLEMRFARADAAFYFRFNRFICLWRVLKRMFARSWHISDVPEGCSKQVRWKLIVYLFRFHHRYQSKIESLKLKYPHVVFYTVRGKSDLKQLRW